MNNKGFMGMVGLLLTAVIICVLAYIAYTRYLGNPSARMDQSTKQTLQDAGIDTTSEMGILQSTKSKIKDIEQIELQRPQQLMNSLDGY